MTKTALENKAIATKEKIARQDRELERDKFKHKKKMDFLGAGLSVLPKLFSTTGGKAIHALHNDPKWYKRYITDLDKFTNIATYVRQGTTAYKDYNYSDGTISSNETGITVRNVPGIMVAEWLPSINSYTGQSAGIPNLPINQILMRTKEQVLKSNSRSNVPYEAADLGINFIATAQILTAITEFERIVLIAQTYQGDNAYYAEGMLEALGANSTWLKNLADARKSLLILKKRFNSALVAPGDMSLYAKWAYLASAWIKDSEVSPASVYAFKAFKYLKLADDGSGLVAITPSRSTPSDFYNQISGMIHVIAENPDYQAMYADLRSAVSNLIQLDESFDENAVITATHDGMALEQYSNLRALPVFYTDAWSPVDISDESLAIQQTDAGYLYQGISENNTGIRFSIGNGEFSENPTTALREINKLDVSINFHKDNITGDDVLDATRGFVRIAPIANTEEQFQGVVTSSDVALIRDFQVYFFTTVLNKQGGVTSRRLGFRFGSSDWIDATGGGSVVDFLTEYAMFTAFDWLPQTKYISVTSDGFDNTTYGDVQHMVPVNRETLDRINDACILSLFYLPIGQFKM